MAARNRQEELEHLLEKRILVLDGAMGTMIQAHELGEEDFRGERLADHPFHLQGNNDVLSLTRPDLIQSIHRAYLEAGADMRSKPWERPLISWPRWSALTAAMVR